MQTSIDLRLARHGVIVLLLGLLVGFAIPGFHNPHLGNVAHLIGLIGGFGTISLSLLWPKLSAPGEIGRDELWWSIALLGGSLCWAFGSVLSKLRRISSISRSYLFGMYALFPSTRQNTLACNDTNF